MILRTEIVEYDWSKSISLGMLGRAGTSRQGRRKFSG